MKRILFFFLEILFSISVFAHANFRPGYIIKSNNDTLYGEISYRNDTRMGKVCIFRLKAKDPEKKYTPDELAGYRFTDSKFFVTKEWNGQKVFMEYLINGSVSIYYYRNSDGDHYFIAKDGVRLSELPSPKVIVLEDDEKYSVHKSTKHIDLLSYYMKDAPLLQKEISRLGPPSHKNLIDLAEKYHDAVCTDGQKCIIYEKKLPPFKMELEARGGISYNPSFGSSFSVAGILAHLWAPRVNENLFLKTGLLFSNSLDDTGLKVRFWQIPVLGEYRFPVKGIIQPEISLGLTALYIPKNLDGVNLYNESNYIPVDLLDLNLHVEAGVNIRLTKSLLWSVHVGSEFVYGEISTIESTGFIVKL